MADKPRLVVGMSGSSAPQLAVAMMERLRELNSVETHFVMSAGARTSLRLEAGIEPEYVCELADVNYDPRDLGAAISSGSFLTKGMVVIPCSMRTLSAVATGNSQELLTRAADVTLKERRRLVLMVRETPFHVGHLRTMTQLAEMGAVIAPPVPAFYSRPQNLEEMIDHSLGRVLDLFGFDIGKLRRWGEEGEPRRLRAANPNEA